MDLLMTIHLHRARWRRIREVSRRVTLNKETMKMKFLCEEKQNGHLPSSAVLWSKASQGWAKTAFAVSLLVGISTSNLEQGCWLQGICENSLFDKFLRAVGHQIKCWVIEAVLPSCLNKCNRLWSWSILWTMKIKSYMIWAHFVVDLSI